MITKERLEELIEQGAIIYGIYFMGVIPINIRKGDYVEQNGTLHTQEKAGCYNYFYNEQLFETIEEAEWHKEFGCIERTERLELPTWEDFSKLKANHVRFISKKGAVCRIEGFCDDKSGFIDVVSGGYSMLMVSDYSKETYIKACRKAKELFLGEKK